MLENAKAIAKEAGILIKEGFNEALEIGFKSNESDLVTNIDTASEKLITNFIKKKYPGHGILAEEGSKTESSSGYVWVIDPLDGTVNFAHGLPIFSVSIGIQKNGETIIGIIYDIMQNVLYTAEKGGGCFANTQEISISSNENLRHSMLVTGFPYNIRENPFQALEKFVELTKASRGMRRLGSAAIDLCYVAKGVFDGFWEVHLNPWDMCAGKLIVEEAGGKVSDFQGKDIDIFSKQILATNGKIHNEMLEILKKY
jgi:myo-inositol-1(or 4)-monophosphatase